MLTVDDYGAIRRARRDGMSIRRDRSRLRSLAEQNPAGPRASEPGSQTRNRHAPVLGPFMPSSTRSWPTTRTLRPSSDIPPRKSIVAFATSTVISAATPRCNDMSSSTAVGIEKRSSPGTSSRPAPRGRFRPHPRRLSRGRRLVPFLVAAWAYSNAPFVLALPFERTEAILEGMVAAFEFFGGVPQEVWWDNPKTVATLILKGRQRQIHPRYNALASHYVFDPRSACQLGATRNPTPREPSRPCNAVRHSSASRCRSRRVEHVSATVQGRA